MITQIEFADLIKIADTDAGLRDLLLQAKEYYLLKRPCEPKPASRSAAEMLAAIRSRFDQPNR